MDETEQTDIDVEFEDEAEALDAFVATLPAPIKRGVGWGAVLPLFLLAGFGGAVGGWALTQYVMPNYIALPQTKMSQAQSAQAERPTLNLGPLTRRIEAAEKKLSAQSSELSFLSSEVKSRSASVTVGGVGETLDITPLLSRLSELEARLETIPKPGVMDARLSDNESVIETDIDDVDKDDTPVVIDPPVSQPSMASIRPAIDFSGDIAALERRIDTLETDIEQTLAMAAAPTIVRDTVLLPPFPRAALLEAMTAPRDQSTQGWVSKTLKKHISVRNPQEVARAQTTLDEIEAFIASRDYAGALALIENMPSDVRSFAGDWTRAVKAEIQTP